MRLTQLATEKLLPAALYNELLIQLVIVVVGLVVIFKCSSDIDSSMREQCELLTIALLPSLADLLRFIASLSTAQLQFR